MIEKFMEYEVVSDLHVVSLYRDGLDGPYVIEDNGTPVHRANTHSEAMFLFIALVEKYSPVEELREPDFRRHPGRPRLHNERMESHSLMFTAEQWSKVQKRGGAAYVRQLIDTDEVADTATADATVRPPDPRAV